MTRRAWAVVAVVLVVVASLIACLTVAFGGASGPPLRVLALLADDPATHQFLLMGGESGARPQVVYSDMWVWNGASWSKLASVIPQSLLAHFRSCTTVYDTKTRELLVVSSIGTWAWDGRNWHEVIIGPRGTAAFVPPVTAAFDNATGQVVMTESLSGATWTWSRGSTWSKVPVTGLSSAVYAAMAYDVARNQLLLQESPVQGNGTSATYAWSETTWRRLDCPEPPGAFDSVMAYDAATKQIVWLETTTSESETWTWNGKAWTRQHPSSEPPLMLMNPLAYDSATRQLLLIGGVGPNDLNTYDGTWDWYGSNWIQFG